MNNVREDLHAYHDSFISPWAPLGNISDEGYQLESELISDEGYKLESEFISDEGYELESEFISDEGYEL